MGTYGYKINEDDTFQETVSDFQEYIEKGFSFQEAKDRIWAEHQKDIDWHIVIFALAECFWQRGETDAWLQSKVADIIESGVDREFNVSLEADEAFLKNRKRAVDRFWKKLQTPKSAGTAPAKKPEPPLLQKGDCFWYKTNGKTFGAVVLEKQENPYGSPLYFILISEELRAKKLEALLEENSYTAAWFDEGDLLKNNRMHFLGKLQISYDYSNQFGLKIEENGSFCCSNVGQTVTWGHSFRSLSFHQETLKSIIERYQ